MSTEQERAELLPCPFCGAGTTEIQENGRPWLGTKWGEPVSVSVRHCCDHVDGQPSRVIERVGRDRASAIDAWNRRAALQSQSMSPEISRDLLGKIVDEVFDGAIEDASVIEDIYRVVARECALQPQYMEDAKRWRALKERSIATFMDNYGRTLMIATVEVDRFPNQITMEGIIDHARRAEGGGE